MLRARSRELQPMLHRHGVGLRADVLADETRMLVDGSGRPRSLLPRVVRDLETSLSALANWIGLNAGRAEHPLRSTAPCGVAAPPRVQSATGRASCVRSHRFGAIASSEALR